MRRATEEPFKLPCRRIRKTENAILVRDLRAEEIWFPLSTVLEENFLYDQGHILIEPWIARAKGLW